MSVETKSLTSEERLGLPKPPEHQCPNIDKIIKAIRLCEKYSGKVDRLDEDELRSNLNDINSELWGLERDLEEVRSACEGIREWGQAWKDLCKSIADEHGLDLQEY